MTGTISAAELRESRKYCRDLTRRAATNFYYSFLVLPSSQRRAIVSVWDFCRAVDDAVDDLRHGLHRLGWAREHHLVVPVAQGDRGAEVVVEHDPAVAGGD